LTAVLPFQVPVLLTLSPVFVRLAVLLVSVAETLRAVYVAVFAPLLVIACAAVCVVVIRLAVEWT
jgi:hypothetical protein